MSFVTTHLANFEKLPFSYLVILLGRVLYIFTTTRCSIMKGTPSFMEHRVYIRLIIENSIKLCSNALS